MLFIQSAYAQAAAGTQGFDFMGLLPILAIFVVFWFLILRPQQKKMKERLSSYSWKKSAQMTLDVYRKAKNNG